MTNQPKTLALLISLIGAGLSPDAQARADLRVVRSPQSALSASTRAPVANALDLTRWTPGLVWRNGEDVLDLPEPSLAVVKPVNAIDDDWAPGEMPAGMPQLDQPGVVATAAAAAIEVARAAPDPQESATAPDPTTEAAGAQERLAAPDAASLPARHEQAQEAAPRPRPGALGWPRRIRSLVQAFGPRHDAAESVGPSTGAQTTAALAPVAADTASKGAAGPAPAAGIAVEAPHAAAVRFVAGLAAPPDTQAAPSPHAERLMQGLATILLDDFAAWPRDLVLARVAERFPAAAAALPGSQPPPPSRATNTHRAADRKIVVTSQAGKVLRTLEAILSGERDEVGAINVDPAEVTVATQADKVLATLGAITSARKAGATTSARQGGRIAVRRWQEQAAALPAATLGMAPLPLAQGRAAAVVDIDITLPPIAEPIAMSAADAAAEPAAHPAPTPAVVSVPPRPRFSPFGTQEIALNETSLDRVRGGFVTDGLNVSFGIERAVYINGALVTTTSLNVSDLGRITAGRGTMAFDSGTLGLIQSGAGNMVTGGSISSTSIGTVVQNTLDGQKVQNLTVINATVNSLGVLRGLNLQSSLRGAVIDSLRR